MGQTLRRLVPRRLRPWARRVYRRRHQTLPYLLRTTVGGALVLTVALSVAGRVWAVAIVAGVALLLAAALDLRQLRRERGLMRVVGAALSAGAQDQLPEACTPLLVRALVDRGDVLDAFAVAGPSVLRRMDLPTRLRLRDGLYARGYLDAAITVAHTCASGPWGRLYRARRNRLEAERRVLSGDMPTPVVRRPAGFLPEPGRVLHIVATSLPTTQAGFTIRTHYITTAQVAAGMVAHVVTQLGYGAARDRVRRTIDGVVYHHLPGPARASMPFDEWLSANIQAIASVVAEVRPAVLHAASDYVNAITARALGDAFDLPVVYESRGFWEESLLSNLATTYGWDLDRLAATHGLPDAYVLRRVLEDRCRRQADRVVTLADVMADRIAAGGVDRRAITVVPNAIDADSFPIQERDHTLAARLGIGAGTTVIGYISSLVEYEGIDTLVDAFAIVRKAGHGTTALLVVGDGAERDSLMRQAAALGLRDVIFTGRVPHESILKYYSLIDIFVVPRRPVEVCHLVTPLKPFEAFATGRTVVMSDVRALASIAHESNAAELFTAGSATSLADTLISLLGDGERRRQLAAAGAAWVRQNRTWTANAARYAALYAELQRPPGSLTHLAATPSTPSTTDGS